MATILSQYDSQQATDSSMQSSFDFKASAAPSAPLNSEKHQPHHQSKKHNQASKNEKSDHIPSNSTGNNSGSNASGTYTTNQVGTNSASAKNSYYIPKQMGLFGVGSSSSSQMGSSSIHQQNQQQQQQQQQASVNSSNNNNSSNGNGNGGGSGNGNSNRRGNKKKAGVHHQAQAAQQEGFRAFFSLRKRGDQGATHTRNNSNQQQLYKPKNSAYILEWFKRLNVQERVNALTTIYPHMTEILINMNKRIEQQGNHSFALKDPICFDYKQLSYASSYGPASSYYGSSSGGGGASSSSSCYQQPGTSFEENFYCREQNEVEMRTIRSTEKDKFNAEQELLKLVRLSDWNEYLDTLSVSPSLVEDADYFLRLMALISNNQAFGGACQWQFETRIQQNSIEQPSWFKPKSFNSQAAWVAVALEETLWAHYNYAFNENVGTAKVSELSQLFKERNEAAGSDVSTETLAHFWKQISQSSKQKVVEQLEEKALKIPRENFINGGCGFGGLRSHTATTMLQRSIQGRDMGFHLKIVDFGNRDFSNGHFLQHENSLYSDKDGLSNSNNPSEDHELKQVLDFSTTCEFSTATSSDKDQQQQQQQQNESGILDVLTSSPLSRADKRQDKLCRELFRLIRQRYQEELVEILLQEEQQQNKGVVNKPTNKKKKKNNNNNNNNSHTNQAQAASQSGIEIISLITTTNENININDEISQQQHSETILKVQNPDEQIATVQKKKKKNRKNNNNNNNNTIQNMVSNDTTTTTNIQVEGQKLNQGTKIDKNKKVIADGQGSASRGTEQPLQETTKKDKKNEDNIGGHVLQNEIINSSKDHYSCDESTNQDPIIDGLANQKSGKKKDGKGGKFSVDSRKSTVGNQSHHTGSTESIQIMSELGKRNNQQQNHINLQQLTASKSVDMKPSGATKVNNSSHTSANTSTNKAKYSSKTDIKNINQTFKNSKDQVAPKAFCLEENTDSPQLAVSKKFGKTGSVMNNQEDGHHDGLKVVSYDEEEVKKQVSDLLLNVIEKVCMKMQSSSSNYSVASKQRQHQQPTSDYTKNQNQQQHQPQSYGKKKDKYQVKQHQSQQPNEVRGCEYKRKEVEENLPLVAHSGETHNMNTINEYKSKKKEYTKDKNDGQIDQNIKEDLTIQQPFQSFEPSQELTHEQKTLSKDDASFHQVNLKNEEESNEVPLSQAKEVSQNNNQPSKNHQAQKTTNNNSNYNNKQNFNTSGNFSKNSGQQQQKQSKKDFQRGKDEYDADYKANMREEASLNTSQQDQQMPSQQQQQQAKSQNHNGSYQGKQINKSGQVQKQKYNQNNNKESLGNEEDQTNQMSQGKPQVNGTNAPNEIDDQDNSSVSTSNNNAQPAKKKRNRKKGKLNEQQIINDFMKNLQTNIPEEVQVPVNQNINSQTEARNNGNFTTGNSKNYNQQPYNSRKLSNKQEYHSQKQSYQPQLADSHNEANGQGQNHKNSNNGGSFYKQKSIQPSHTNSNQTQGAAGHSKPNLESSQKPNNVNNTSSANGNAATTKQQVQHAGKQTSTTAQGGNKQHHKDHHNQQQKHNSSTQQHWQNNKNTQSSNTSLNNNANVTTTASVTNDEPISTSTNVTPRNSQSQQHPLPNHKNNTVNGGIGGQIQGKQNTGKHNNSNHPHQHHHQHNKKNNKHTQAGAGTIGLQLEINSAIPIGQYDETLVANDQLQNNNTIFNPVIQQQTQTQNNPTNQETPGFLNLQSEIFGQNGFFKFQGNNQQIQLPQIEQNSLQVPLQQFAYPIAQDWDNSASLDTINMAHSPEFVPTVPVYTSNNNNTHYTEEFKSNSNLMINTEENEIAKEKQQYSNYSHKQNQLNEQDIHGLQNNYGIQDKSQMEPSLQVNKFQSHQNQYLGEGFVPPLSQSPFSSLSTQAQSFTPKGYNKFSFGTNNHQQHNTHSKRHTTQNMVAPNNLELMADEYSNGPIQFQGVTPNKVSMGGASTTTNTSHQSQVHGTAPFVPINRQYGKNSYPNQQQQQQYNNFGYNNTGIGNQTMKASYNSAHHNTNQSQYGGLINGIHQQNINNIGVQGDMTNGVVQNIKEFQTPPQMSKKQSSNSIQSQGVSNNNSHNQGGNHKKSHNNNNNNNGSGVSNQGGHHQSSNQNPNGNNRHNQKHHTHYRQPGRMGQYQSQMVLPLQGSLEGGQIQGGTNNNNLVNSNQYYFKSPTPGINMNHQQQQQLYQDYNSHQSTMEAPTYQFQQGANPMAMQSPQIHYSPQLNATTYRPPIQPMLDTMGDLSNTNNHQMGGGHPRYNNSSDLLMQIFSQINHNGPVLMGNDPFSQHQQQQPLILDFQPTFQSTSGIILNSDKPIFYQQQLEKAFFNKLDLDIYQYVDQIKEKIEILKPERDFVFQKISKTVDAIYEGKMAKLLLFGSLSTGLALESSDMDLAVTGLYLSDKYAMVSEMQKLANVLQKWEFAESFKYIDTATVPVIKMKINLEKLRSEEMTESAEGDFKKRSISKEAQLLSIDITFDDTQADYPSSITNNSGNVNMGGLSPNSIIANNNGSNGSHSYNPYGNVGADVFPTQSSQKTHLGIQSCALVKYYVENYPHLKEVAILLKQFMATHNFNSPYYGGISAYSTILILVAYMNYFGLANCQLSPSRLLVGFLEFYGTYFQPNQLGVSVLNDGSFFSLIGTHDSNIVILDPLNLQNNTTRNSYHTREILNKLNTTFQKLKELVFGHPSLAQHQGRIIGQGQSLSTANASPQNSYQQFGLDSNDGFQHIPQFVPSKSYSPSYVHQMPSLTSSHITQFNPEQPFASADKKPEQINFHNSATNQDITQADLSELYAKVNLLDSFFGIETSSPQNNATTANPSLEHQQQNASGTNGNSPMNVNSYGAICASNDKQNYNSTISSPKC